MEWTYGLLFFFIEQFKSSGLGFVSDVLAMLEDANHIPYDAPAVAPTHLTTGKNKPTRRQKRDQGSPTLFQPQVHCWVISQTRVGPLQRPVECHAVVECTVAKPGLSYALGDRIILERISSDSTGFGRYLGLLTAVTRKLASAARSSLAT